eukprot:TRINITY_DN2603_c0_g1_i1.p1 TRINITY_DN2603_c0_g1~~TRINITY_DN2603_c0_g1_i1.p1  ORF type:complete len:277 (+),score=29.79 TRINITY_DN2603_c0_g1_i1:87-833(+)
MKVVDLKREGARYLTSDAKANLIEVFKTGYSERNMLVRCACENSDEYAEKYARFIVENLGGNEVAVGLVRIDEDGRETVVGVGAVFRYRRVSVVTDRISGYLSELEELAFATMQADRGKNDSYDAFLTAYANDDLVLETGKSCTTIHNGLSQMGIKLITLSYQTGARFMIGRASDHGRKFTINDNSFQVASLCYCDSKALRPHDGIPEATRKLLTTPLQRTGKPPASHFVLIDMWKMPAIKAFRASKI